MGVEITISSKGQIVIPKDVRDALGFVAGQKLDVIPSGDGVFLRPAARKSGRSSEEIFARLRDIAPPWEGPPATIDDMNRAVDSMMRDRWGDKP
jgi:AbrB family looped-hinge helix DNA binding protein